MELCNCLRRILRVRLHDEPIQMGGQQRRRRRRRNVEYANIAIHTAFTTTASSPSTITPTPSSTRTSCLFCGGAPRVLCRRPQRVHWHSLRAPAVCLRFAGDFAFDFVFGPVNGLAFSFAHGSACAYIAMPLEGIPRGASASRVGTSFHSAPPLVAHNVFADYGDISEFDHQPNQHGRLP